MRRPRTRVRSLTVLMSLAVLVSLVGALFAGRAAQSGPNADRAALPALDAAPDALRAAVTRDQFYFFLPDRFVNGDPSNDQGGLTGSREVTGFDPTGSAWYHGGDLKGAMGKLDYIKGLGTTAIWLTPVFKNAAVQGLGTPYPGAGYHGYWITDFTQVDPHLGTNADLVALIQQSHQRGMKVYLDIVVNHTADVIQPTQKPGGPVPPSYVLKKDAPYTDTSGTAFDDRSYAGTQQFPTLSAQTSFPYLPTVSPGQESVKAPAWLNDVTLYHNRGNTTYAGESNTYGDFAGLDDLFTENPRVVTGMQDIFDYWIQNFGIDGFRIDTMKYVNIEFWQQFLPHILATAHAAGKPDFFVFGEVYDLLSDPYLSRFTTEGRGQAVLDFTFQQGARDFGASKPATQLAAVFADDDWFTDADSNAYQLPTFLGNHDMGHIGAFLRDDNPTASAAELLQRDELLHALLFTSRGNPVVYYGDEQGFTGASGGDKASRQDMFASQDPDYSNQGADAGRDQDIGSVATPMNDNFDPTHPLYATIAALSKLRADNPALADGIQQNRFASTGPGIFAFSRTDATAQVEYVVALNNATSTATAAIPTYSAGMRFDRIWGDPASPSAVTSATDASLTVQLPPLSAVVFRAEARIAPSASSPAVTLTVPAQATGRPEISVAVSGTSTYQVSFYLDSGHGWELAGTDDNAPYRVFPDLSRLPVGAQVRVAALLKDNAGHVSSASGSMTVSSAPDTTGTAIVHYHRDDGAYSAWGLHVWGDGVADGVSTDWATPRPPSRTDDFGAVFEVPLGDITPTLSFLIHQPSGSDVPATQEPGGNHAFVPATTREVWISSGDPTLHTSRP